MVQSLVAKISENYISLLVNRWREEISELSCPSLIAKTQPQAAYFAFTLEYRHRFTYLLNEDN